MIHETTDDMYKTVKLFMDRANPEYSRARRFLWRCMYGLFGIPFGWWAAHYFVIEYGGVWPEKTFVHMLADATGVLVGSGGVVALVTAAINIWGKKKDKP